MKAAWKQKLRREMRGYFANVAYLFLFFGLFAMYRRLILAQYQISYLNWGASLVEAMVLGKVIMLGEILKLGRRLEHRPLIYPTIYKTLIFSILVGAFTILEEVVTDLIRGRGYTRPIHHMVFERKYELVAECLVTFFAFIPFFAFKELGRAIGKGRIKALFLRADQSIEPAPD